jgi:GNAT superfamily N-acetyltransferase
MLPDVTIEPAMASDAAEFVRLRGRTRENAVSETRLASFSITPGSWAEDVRTGLLAGFTAKRQGNLLGYCFGNTRTGEVVVLALLPEAEGHGIGRELLGRVVLALRERGHRRLFLGCSSNPNVRSYGFYRRLGWRSTGTIDSHEDEVLELNLEPARSAGGVA